MKPRVIQPSVGHFVGSPAPEHTKNKYLCASSSSHPSTGRKGSCKNIWHLKDCCEITPICSKSALHSSVCSGWAALHLHEAHLSPKQIIALHSTAGTCCTSNTWISLLDCDASSLCSSLLLNKLQRKDISLWFLCRYELNYFHYCN